MTLAIALLLSAFMAVVFYLDATRFTIPNWLNASLLLLFGVWCLFTPQPPEEPLTLLYAFGAVFSVGFAMFAFNVMGGGDVKLLAVLALWCGWSEALVTTLFYTCFLGGGLAVALLALRFVMPMIGAKCGWQSIPKIFTHKEPVPYGLAIAGGFLIALWGNKLPTVPLVL